MSKRKLSKQQQARIADKQRRELDSEQQHRNTDARSGRIVSHFGQQLEVESLDENSNGQVVRCYQRANLPDLVTGDHVLWQQEDNEEGVIIAMKDRDNLFYRQVAEGKSKPVAANIDLVLVVFALVPEPHTSLIDRYLVALDAMGLPAALVLNKQDLLSPSNTAEFDKVLSIYSSLGYPAVAVSATEGTGLAALQELLAGKTTVVVGQSGVGKSSLINCLGQRDLAAVGALSEAHSKGIHTTTTAHLYHLADCDLIDSPGIRDFSVDHLSREQIQHGYRELRTLSGLCKFRDCSHRNEPGCAVQPAVAEGTVSEERLQNYLHLLQLISTQ